MANQNPTTFNSIFGSNVETYEEFINALQVYLINNSQVWNTLYSSGMGQTLIEFIAGIGAYNQFSIERSVQESFLETANDPKSILDLASQLGNSIQGYKPSVTLLSVTNKNSSASITFSLYDPTRISSTGSNGNTNNAFTINGGNYIVTQVLDKAGKSYPYLTLNPNQSCNLYVQEATIEIVDNFAISNGLPFQTYFVGNNFQYYAATVIISDAANGNSTVYWKSVNALYSLGENDEKFQLTNTSTGELQIVFGNGLSGKIPVTNSKISLILSGSSGGKLNTTTSTYKAVCNNQGATDTLEITPLLPITNGSSTLPLSEYRNYSSIAFASLDRIVVDQDATGLLVKYINPAWKQDYVFKDVKCLSVRDILYSRRTFLNSDSKLANYLMFFYAVNGNSLNNETIFIPDLATAPADADVHLLEEWFMLRHDPAFPDTTSLYDKLQKDTDKQVMKNVFYDFFPTFPNLVNITLTANLSSNVNSTTVTNQLEQIIVDFFKIAPTSTGKSSILQPFYTSTLIQQLLATFGVSSVTITELSFTIPDGTVPSGYVEVTVEPKDYLKPLYPIAGAYSRILSTYDIAPHSLYHPSEFMAVFGGKNITGVYEVPVYNEDAYWLTSVNPGVFMVAVDLPDLQPDSAYVEADFIKSSIIINTVYNSDMGGGN